MRHLASLLFKLVRIEFPDQDSFILPMTEVFTDRTSRVRPWRANIRKVDDAEVAIELSAPLPEPAGAGLSGDAPSADPLAAPIAAARASTEAEIKTVRQRDAKIASLHEALGHGPSPNRPTAVTLAWDLNAWTKRDINGETALADIPAGPRGDAGPTGVSVMASGEPVPAGLRVDREALGRRVREVWIEWAREQPSPKGSWLLPWENLAEPDREVDRRIGEALVAVGVAAASVPAGPRVVPLPDARAEAIVEIAEALAFYGDPDTWRIPLQNEMANADDAPTSDGQADAGECARSALRRASSARRSALDELPSLTEAAHAAGYAACQADVVAQIDEQIAVTSAYDQRFLSALNRIREDVTTKHYVGAAERAACWPRKPKGA